MAWSTATEIMDAATAAADAAVHHVYDDLATGLPVDSQAVDDVLRPFVVKIAEVLRENGWHRAEDAEAFDRFRPEMLGYDDDGMITWYREKLSETDDPAAVREYADALAAIMERPH